MKKKQLVKVIKKNNKTLLLGGVIVFLAVVALYVKSLVMVPTSINLIQEGDIISHTNPDKIAGVACNGNPAILNFKNPCEPEKYRNVTYKCKSNSTTKSMGDSSSCKSLSNWYTNVMQVCGYSCVYPSISPTPYPSPSLMVSPKPSPTPKPSLTPTPTPTPKPTPTTTYTPTPTPTPTP